jgi:hypothetical protein
VQGSSSAQDQGQTVGGRMPRRKTRLKGG